MLEFLRLLHQETVNELQNFNVHRKPDHVKTGAVIVKTRLEMIAMFYNLPDNVKKLVDDGEKTAEQKLKFVNSQEGGSI